MKFTFKPYSNDIIFFDTEFSSNDPKTAELLSLGMVKMSGEELYLELKVNKPVSKWVEKNVMPKLTNDKISPITARRKINEFVGKKKYYLMAYVVPFDYVYLYKMLGYKDLNSMPFYWPPLDFASILFGNNISPKAYYNKDNENFFKDIGVDAGKYNHHNALGDAQLLREVYMKMVKT